MTELQDTLLLLRSECLRKTQPYLERHFSGANKDYEIRDRELLEREARTASEYLYRLFPDVREYHRYFVDDTMRVADSLSHQSRAHETSTLFRQQAIVTLQLAGLSTSNPAKLLGESVQAYSRCANAMQSAGNLEESLRVRQETILCVVPYLRTLPCTSDLLGLWRSFQEMVLDIISNVYCEKHDRPLFDAQHRHMELATINRTIDVAMHAYMHLSQADLGALENNDIESVAMTFLSDAPILEMHRQQHHAASQHVQNLVNFVERLSRERPWLDIAKMRNQAAMVHAEIEPWAQKIASKAKVEHMVGANDQKRTSIIDSELQSINLRVRDLYEANNVDAAQEMARRALARANQVFKPVGEDFAIAHAQAGWFCHNFGDRLAAKLQYGSAVKILERTYHRWDFRLANVLRLLALVCNQLDHHEQAQEYIERSLQIIERQAQLDSKLLGRILQDRAHILLHSPELGSPKDEVPEQEFPDFMWDVAD